MKKIFRAIFSVITFISRFIVGALSYTMLICVILAPIFAVGSLTYVYFKTFPIIFYVYFLGCLVFLVFISKIIKKITTNGAMLTSAADWLFITWVPILWPTFLFQFIIIDLARMVSIRVKDFINWVYKD